MMTPTRRDADRKIPPERAQGPLWMASGPGETARAELNSIERARSPLCKAQSPVYWVFSFGGETKMRNLKCAQRLFILPNRTSRASPSIPRSQTTEELVILDGIPTGGNPDEVAGDEVHAHGPPEKRRRSNLWRSPPRKRCPRALWCPHRWKMALFEGGYLVE